MPACDDEIMNNVIMRMITLQFLCDHSIVTTFSSPHPRKDEELAAKKAQLAGDEAPTLSAPAHHPVLPPFPPPDELPRPPTTTPIGILNWDRLQATALLAGQEAAEAMDMVLKQRPLVESLPEGPKKETALARLQAPMAS